MNHLIAQKVKTLAGCLKIVEIHIFIHRICCWRKVVILYPIAIKLNLCFTRRKEWHNLMTGRTKMLCQWYQPGSKSAWITYKSLITHVDVYINGLHLYSALQFMSLIHPFTHSPIHPFTHLHIHTPTVIGCHERYQPARQEQLGVRRLAQGHFDMSRVGSNRQPSDCQTTALTSWVISPPYVINNS